MLITEAAYPRIWELHPDMSPMERRLGFNVDDDLYAKFRVEADANMPHLAEADKVAWAVYNAHQHPGFKSPGDSTPPGATSHSFTHHDIVGLPKAVAAAEEFTGVTSAIGEAISKALDTPFTHDISLKPMDIDLSHFVGPVTITVNIPALDHLAEAITSLKPRWGWVKGVIIAIGLIIAALLLVSILTPGAHAQVVQIRGANGGSNVTTTGTSLNVNCTGGCGGGGGGGTSSTFGAAFPATGTAVGYLDRDTGEMHSFPGDDTDGIFTYVTRLPTVVLDNTTPFNVTVTNNPQSTFGAVFPSDGVPAGFISSGGNLAGANLDAGGRLITTGAGGTFPVTGTFFQATQPVSIAGTVAVSGPLTDTQLRATAVPVSMTSTTITGTVAVTGTFFQATQPVSIAATVTVAGAKTNNNAAPGATNVGALGCIANAAAPTWTEGNLVGCSTDLAGNQRVILVAGTAVIGHVITDATSVTAATLTAETTKVIGVVRTADGSGNLLTSTSNAMDVNLKTSSITLPVSLTSTTVTGNVTVVQPTGTNLHAVLDANSGVDIGKLTANQSVNVSQINGVTPLMGAGNTGTGSPRVTIATDQVSIPVAATLTAETTKVIGTARILGNLGAAVDAATGAAPPANAILAGGVTSGATGGFITGIPVCDTYVNVNIATATTTLIVTGVSGRHVRICEIDLLTAAANNVGIISGTGATCGTGSAAIVGTTAATGYNFAANGGIATGDGIGMVKRTVATGDSVCIITSATTQLSGGFSYTIY